jgi:hypothetical protein
MMADGARWEFKSRVMWAVLVVTVITINTTTMPALYYLGDPFAMREEARSILLEGRLAVDSSIAAHFGERGQYFVAHDGLYYSKYGVMNALMFFPPLLVERLASGKIPALTSDSRLLLLNLYNVGLSALLASFLFRLANLYTRNLLASAVYVLMTLYGTFLWNYLRGQSGEIFQVLFFTGFYYHIVKFIRARKDLGGPPVPGLRTEVSLAWGYLAALCLTKVSYVLIVGLPWLALAFTARREGYSAFLSRRLVLTHFLMPTLAIVSVIGVVHWIKFGSPFLTGYHQWRSDQHTLSGDIVEGVYGFLFSIQRSVFIHFPVLLVSMLSLRKFWNRHRIDMILSVTVFLVYLSLIGKLPSWKGEDCYGPRYLLFVLPVLSLPFVLVLDDLINLRDRFMRLVASIVFGSVLWVSVSAQVDINRLPFMTYYDIRSPVEPDANMAISDYFLNHHFSKINNDLSVALTRPDSLPYLCELKKKWSSERFHGYLAYIRRVAGTTNYYWRK